MNTESRFSGLCLGGPNDGKMCVHPSPTLEFAHRLPLSVMDLDPSAPKASAPVVVQRSVYDYVPLTHAQGVWLHESLRQEGVGLSVVAVSHLAENYRPLSRRSGLSQPEPYDPEWRREGRFG